MWYVILFVAVVVVDLIPIVAPPAWSVMVFLLVRFDLNPWVVLGVGVPASVLGRYLFSLYVPKFSAKFIKRHKKEELEFLGKKLSQKLWRSWLFVLIYTVTPLSSTPLFTAAGIAKVKPMQTLPPFFVGKFVSDAVMIFTGRYAAGNLGELVHGTFSAKGILTLAAGLFVLGGFLFVNWRAFLQDGKLKFTFRIWK